MNYQSTRGGAQPVSAAQAIVRGLAPDGGLYVPEVFPSLPVDRLLSDPPVSYQELAVKVLSSWLVGFSEDEIREIAEASYTRFDDERVAPVKGLHEGAHVLELFHGPTLAFKDVALQMLPHLMTRSARKIGETRTIEILVATSGDTGKAALEGFMDVKGVKIAVYYPEGGVSEVQRLQMVTQPGENTRVVAIQGNFDDAQTGVKRIFTDERVRERLDAQGVTLSSANSINLGRLIPQIVYYYSAYLQLVEAGSIAPGDAINVTVPTGNFGNILAAFYAKRMGLPIHRLVCASNSNHVLSDLIQTGVYDRNRAFHLTTSPSMDILISSNLERLLYEISGRDAGQVRTWMDELKDTGRYRLTEAAHSQLTGWIWGDWATEDTVNATIHNTFKDHGALIDPHTAVAVAVAERYQEKTGDRTPMVIASTASPYKFGAAVLSALKAGEAIPEDEFECLRALSEMTDTPIPAAIGELRSLPVRHNLTISPNAMTETVF